MQDAHLAETRQSFPKSPQHQQLQRQNQQFEGRENFDYYVDHKTGWRYYREPRGNPPAASSSSTSQWPTSQWQTSWSSWLPTSSENCWWLRFPGKNSRSDGACGQDTHSQNTSAQHSLFTSAERTPRAWLKSHGLQCHLCAPEKSRVIWCRTCLTRCYRSLGAHHLPHSLFLLPRHKNTQHNRCNTVTSKNTQFIMRISKLSQSTSSAIKNRSGVKTCRVAETRARQLPQKQHLLGPMTWKVTRRDVWQDIANLRRKRLNNETMSQHHAWMTINLKKKEWVSRRTVCSLLTNWSEMSVFSSYWETWHFVVCEQACACYNKMDKIFCFKTLILQETLKTQNQHQEEFCAFSEVTRLCQ